MPEAPDSAATPVVLLHGYGAGLGFFFRNFGALGGWSARTGAPVYALDWLGMGRSARLPFRIRAARTDVPRRVHEAESFFVDALEEWRVKMGLERMTLVGHSLGAYFSVVYALRYPTRVSKLILLSPAGVLGGPEDTTQPSREVTDSQDQVAGGPQNGKAVEEAGTQRVKDVKEEQHRQKERESRTRRLFQYLWEEGWSPFQLVRTMNVFGPMVVARVRPRLTFSVFRG